MSDLPKPGDAAPATTGLWFTIKKPSAGCRTGSSSSRWPSRLTVLAIAVLIPATGIYSFALYRKQAAVAEQVKPWRLPEMPGEGVWTLNDKLPVVFGTGSVLSFLEANPVERITVIYEPLMWNVSERIILIESQGRSTRITRATWRPKIFADKAVTALWGGKLVFIPRAELNRPRRPGIVRATGPAFCRRPPAVREGRLEGRRQRCAVGRADARLCWPSCTSSSRASSSHSSSSSRRRCTAPSTTWWAWMTSRPRWRRSRTSISAARRMPSTASSKPFNVMFSGPAGTGKTRLASYLAKELTPAHPVSTPRPTWRRATSLAARTRSAASWPWPSGASTASSSWTRRRTFS
jgi:cell division protease FtsH